ncbi:iodotyrosine deiodinase 1 isoform X2 [Belonocnema kinseyi]|uniref:iodotyrosine deiodinase 1 isoform X2 n=1 Tax=Belonocnema kinseyi TaxID=2817044 RepID=UPI00143DB2EA|nr:iodotyrosine deiodinase 1 isoform X2 [Belonocnema kinseyi]
MISEILPFWSKYWHYILITVATYVYVMWKSGKMKSDLQDYDNEMEREIPSEEAEKCASNEEEPALPKDLQHIPYKYQRPSEAEMRKKANEFFEIANARRTLRFFSSDPVPKDVIREIIRAAGTAPSGAHTEPWIFVVISDPATKTQIREIVENEEEINYRKRMGKKWTIDLQPLKTNSMKPYLTTAPYLILVFKQTYGILPNGTRKIHYYNEMSVSIACGILISAIQIKQETFDFDS